MKKVILVLTGTLIVLVAGTYYHFSGREFVIRLSESELLEKLDQKLPLTKTYLMFIQVTLENPRIHLENGTNRARIGLDVVLNITLNDDLKPVGGIVQTSGGICYAAEKGQFILTNPVIENLDVQGIPQAYTTKAKKALTEALGEYYSRHPLYTLRVTDMKQAAARMVLKDAAVENKELVITLGI